MELFIIAGIVIFLAFFFSNKSNKSQTNHVQKRLISNQNKINTYLHEHELSNKKKYLSNDYSNGIIYDEDKEEIHLITKKHLKKSDGTLEYNFYKYKADLIIQSEIIFDNQTVYKTDRGSQLIGAAVGGLAFGSLGAIIAGLSSQKTKNETVKSIQMKLLIDDIDSPSYKINFLSNVDIYTAQINKNGYSKDSSQVKAALTNIERWQGIMEILIRKQNKAVNS